MTGRQLLLDLGVSKIDWITTFDFVVKGNRSNEGAIIPIIRSMDFEGFIASNFEGYVTKFAAIKTLKSIASCKLTLDKRVALHRVGTTPGPLNLNQKSFLNNLSTFGDNCPRNGSKNDLTAPRMSLGYPPKDLVWYCRAKREQREFLIGNLLVRVHFIIGMIWWTGLAPCEFEFHFL